MRARSHADAAKGAGDIAHNLLREIEALSGPKAARAWQRKVRAGLPSMIGAFPARRPPVPPARITGRIERPDCSIEKIVFESQPRFYVTANLYLPKRGKRPAPAVLFTCGHATEGKAYPCYHACSLGLAAKGYAVLNFDPLGQGERSQFLLGRDVWPVTATVAQHNAVGRPAFLLGRTLLLYRIWDGLRAMDYLLSRPEIDRRRVAVVGNSGGGEMARVLAAVDERIAVCAAFSPGGSCESVYLTGLRWPREILFTLIAPRPLLVHWGRAEAKGVATKDFVPAHVRALYRKLGADPEVFTLGQRADGLADPSTHSLERPHREDVYAWLNHWLDNAAAGREEGSIEAESEQRLRCTASGQVATEYPDAMDVPALNRALLEKVVPRRRLPRSRSEAESERQSCRATARRVFGMASPTPRPPPAGGVKEITGFRTHRIEKVVLEGDDDFVLRGLLHVPAHPAPTIPVLFASEYGKESTPELQAGLVKAGVSVFALDVRHTAPKPGRQSGRPRDLAAEMGYRPDLYTYDQQLIDAAGRGQAMAGSQTGDILRAIDWLDARPEYAGRGVCVIGEGIGGLWALLAAAFDRRVAAAVAWRSLSSFRSLVEAPYYSFPQFHGWFWFPGLLSELDIPDLVTLAAPRPVLLLDPLAPDTTVLAALAPERAWRRASEHYRLLGARGGVASACSGRSPARRNRILLDFLVTCNRH